MMKSKKNGLVVMNAYHWTHMYLSGLRWAQELLEAVVVFIPKIYYVSENLLIIWEIITKS